MVDKENIAWCPGCGDYMIRDVLEETLKEMKLQKNKVVITSGIGQAAKMPQYLDTNFFNGLHGRSLPPACGTKLTRPKLTVIAISGDGCVYGEGGNHFLHTIRKDLDITILVCDNKIYGLTKGQSSPTSDKEIKLSLAPEGNHYRAINPLALAITAGCGFVARGFSGEKEHLKKIIKEAIKHQGTSLVDIFQPCVSFNKINTFQWYKQHTKKLSAPAQDKYEALKLAEKWDKEIPLGIIYQKEQATYQPDFSFKKNLSDKQLAVMLNKNH